MSTTKNKFQEMDFPFSIKQLNEQLGTFEGYCSTYEVDKQLDKIIPGAFSKTLADAKAKRDSRGDVFLYALLYMHNPHKCIGGLYDAYEDSKGLFVRGMIDLDTEQGRRAYSGMKKGYCRSFSIGYRVKRDRIAMPNLRILEEIDLIEVSVVSMPANEGAFATNVKTAQQAWTEAMIKDMERTAERLGAKKARSGMADYNRPAFSRTGYSEYDEPQAPYRIEPGKHPEESRVEFNKELRAQLRAEDDELYTLHGKAFDREVERRRQQREEKQRLQREALEAERKAQADARIEPLEEYTPQRFTDKVGLDLVWFTRFLEACTARDEITPVMEGTMVFKGADLMGLCRRHHEDIEQQAIRANHKRAERLAREGRGA